MSDSFLYWVAIVLVTILCGCGWALGYQEGHNARAPIGGTYVCQ